MRKKYGSLFFVGVAMVSPMHAAKPLILKEMSFNELKENFDVVVPHVKKTVAESVDTLQLVQQHIDKNNVTHIGMQQYYSGFPVHGGYAITHGAHSAQIVSSRTDQLSLTGVVYKGLKKELGRPPAVFLQRTKLAMQQFKAQYQRYLVEDEQITPMIYINDKLEAFWAYKVSALVYHEDDIPERPTAILDATTFKPFLQWNDVKTVRLPINGIGFGGNARVGLYQFGKDLPVLQLRRDNLLGICYMENRQVKVVDMLHKYSWPTISMQYPCAQRAGVTSHASYWTGYQGDGYDMANGAFSPSNDALYVGQVVLQMYKNEYGTHALMKDDKPMRLTMRVHFGKGYENAFWDGEKMTFGDGASLLHPLVSIGTGAHEISHGFTEQHSGLEYVGQSGGMNEAFSDMAAQAVEFYANGENSWMMGAEIVKEGSGYKALRFMDRPSRDGKSIDRADQYQDEMNVHYSSGVYNRLFYLLAHQPQWNTKKAFQVMLKANMDYWTPYSTFNEGACGIISATTDLGFSVSDVEEVLEKVRLSC